MICKNFEIRLFSPSLNSVTRHSWSIVASGGTALVPHFRVLILPPGTLAGLRGTASRILLTFTPDRSINPDHPSDCAAGSNFVAEGKYFTGQAQAVGEGELAFHRQNRLTFTQCIDHLTRFTRVASGYLYQLGVRVMVFGGYVTVSPTRVSCSDSRSLSAPDLSPPNGLEAQESRFAHIIRLRW